MIADIKKKKTPLHVAGRFSILMKMMYRFIKKKLKF